MRRPAKWVLNRLANYMTKGQFPDLNSGLRSFRRNLALQYFVLLPDQLSWTATITLAMHCDKYAVAYLPIHYWARRGQSKIVPWDAGGFRGAQPACGDARAMRLGRLNAKIIGGRTADAVEIDGRTGADGQSPTLTAQWNLLGREVHQPSWGFRR